MTPSNWIDVHALMESCEPATWRVVEPRVPDRSSQPPSMLRRIQTVSIGLTLTIASQFGHPRNIQSGLG
jgi:hypothetical protein